MRKRKNQYLKLREIRYYLGVPEQTLAFMLHNDKVPLVYVRGVCYVPRRAFFAWLETRSLSSAA